jgi:hypothetical protein
MELKMPSQKLAYWEYGRKDWFALPGRKSGATATQGK